MEGRHSARFEKQAQWLADLQEDLDLVRYPARREMLRAIEEASHRADSLARLDYALEHMSLR